jgi:hypothetical protein
VGMKKLVELDLANLEVEEVKKIRSMARLEKFNVFYDANKIIAALADRVIKLLEKDTPP